MCLVYVCMYIHMCVLCCVCLYVYVCVYVDVSVFVFARVYVHLCMYCIHMYEFSKYFLCTRKT